MAVSLAGDQVREARITLGGVATRPWRSREAEQLRVGGSLARTTALAAGRAAFTGARPLSDNGYKVELGAQTVAHALTTAKDRA